MVHGTPPHELGWAIGCSSAISVSQAGPLAFVGLELLRNEVPTFNWWPRSNVLAVGSEHFDLGVDLGIRIGVRFRIALGADLNTDFNPAAAFNKDIG